jgi:vacuolar iron transporter family protein
MTQALRTTPRVAKRNQGDPHLIARLQQNWALEMDGAAMYRALAERERIPERKRLFRRMAETEFRHAEQWDRRLQELNARVPRAHDGQGHATRVAATPGGLRAILRAVEAEERRDVADYLRQMREVEDEATSAILREVILDEFAQAQILRRLYSASSAASPARLWATATSCCSRDWPA